MSDTDAEKVEDLAVLLFAATSFRFGKRDDEDTRDWVLVTRQYNVPKARSWTIARVSHERGIVSETVKEYGTQGDAIYNGVLMLSMIRSAD